MRLSSRQTKGRSLLGFLVGFLSAAIIAGGGVAIAAIPASDTGEITGCYTIRNGDVRVIDLEAGDTCTKNETQIEWNQTGPAGPAGAIGATGPAGPQGQAGPQGEVGPAGPQGQQGPAGPAGADGATGPAGATGVVTTRFFAGSVGSIAPSSPSVWAFAGPTSPVTTTTATQRLTGAATAQMGMNAGSPMQSGDVDLCYQANGGGTLSNFSGFSNFMTTQFFGGERRGYAATASVVPGAGSWNVGFCVRNRGTSAISNNDFVNGWVMVTN